MTRRGPNVVIPEGTLFNVNFVRPESWADQVNPSQLQDSVGSIAGICLIIGILHGINVFVVPFIGSILALRNKLMEPRPG